MTDPRITKELIEAGGVGVCRSSVEGCSEHHEGLFWEKVRKTETCWLWTASLDPDGYGQFGPRVNRKKFKHRAHRFSWEHSNGPIPDGMVLDHVCRVRHCVNPDHLRTVTDAENILAGIGPSAINSRKSKCLRGHEFDYVDRHGWRQCTRCHNDARRKRRAAARAAAVPDTNEGEKR